MNALAWLTALIAMIFGLLLLRFSTRRVSLQNRLELLAPGSGFADVAHFARPSRARRISKLRIRQVESELPDLVELLATSILAGATLHSALLRVGSHSKGLVSRELSSMMSKLELGSNIDQELSALCERLPLPGIREFANKLALAIARGTPLSDSLVALSQSLRKKQLAIILAKAGSNETKMLIPLVALVLPTTVIFATYPSVQFLSIGFN